MNYNEYQLTVLDNLKCLPASLAISGMVSFLFYDSLWGMVVFPAIMIFLRKSIRNNVIATRKEKLSQQILDGLRAISTALLAGYSVENAWKEAQNEIGLLYGEDNYMYMELEEMNRCVEMNVPLELRMNDFAYRSGVEDIESFAEIFSFAKRSGGDFVHIIDSTTNRMCEKYETRREIEVLIASKKLEQKVMNVIPLGILAYLKLTSMDYLSVLYGNLFGVFFMTVCLILYGFAMVLSEKVLEIQV